MAYYYGKYIQDGSLDSHCGRIVIYKGNILHAQGPSADHNYLLRSLAARSRENRDAVIGGAVRLYFTREGGDVIISPVRKIDDDDFLAHEKEYAALIKSVIR
jgi:hypothetical protein